VAVDGGGFLAGVYANENGSVVVAAVALALALSATAEVAAVTRKGRFEWGEFPFLPTRCWGGVVTSR